MSFNSIIFKLILLGLRVSHLNTLIEFQEAPQFTVSFKSNALIFCFFIITINSMQKLEGRIVDSNKNEFKPEENAQKASFNILSSHLCVSNLDPKPSEKKAKSIPFENCISAKLAKISPFCERLVFFSNGRNYGFESRLTLILILVLILQTYYDNSDIFSY